LAGGWAQGLHRPGVNTADYDSLAASVHAIAVAVNRQRYVGGNFDVAGDVYAGNITRWDRTRWFPLEPSVVDGVLKRSWR